MFSNTPCLFCYQNIEASPHEYHSHCAKKLFDQSTPPDIAFGLDHIESLAKTLISQSLTVTGVQRKLSVSWSTLTQARMTLVNYQGNYILKPPSQEYPEMPELEDLCMKTASICEIPTATHGLIRLQSGELAYLVRRFDRIGKVPFKKIHVEDMAQVTGKLTADKYRSSMERVGKAILHYTTNKGFNASLFFDLALHSYLIGNADMHLKNFSILYKDDGEIALTPAYDLLSTKLLLPEDDEEMALSIQGKKKKLKLSHFVSLGKYLKLQERTIENTFQRFINSEPQIQSLIQSSLVSPALKQGLSSLVQQRLALLK